jgi:hypothetical protein
MNRLEGDRFCSFERVLLKTHCTYWCDGQNLFVMHFFARLKKDLQIIKYKIQHFSLFILASTGK